MMKKKILSLIALILAITIAMPVLAQIPYYNSIKATDSEELEQYTFYEGNELNLKYTSKYEFNKILIGSPSLWYNVYVKADMEPSGRYAGSYTFTPKDLGEYKIYLRHEAEWLEDTTFEVVEQPEPEPPSKPMRSSGFYFDYEYGYYMGQFPVQYVEVILIIPEEIEIASFLLVNSFDALDIEFTSDSAYLGLAPQRFTGDYLLSVTEGVRYYIFYQGQIVDKS
ncbi:MAG: hypothetical protein ACTSRU_11000 [Candidatus Hodarchaeales archaeon]